jgi:Protein of unknown function (DUF3558)
MRPAKVLIAAAAALVLLLAACSGSGDSPGPEASQTAGAGAGAAKHGLSFSECGGVSDEEVAKQTRVTGLVNTAKNSVGCQWLAGGQITGPHFSFSWYRGSPIGRERKTEELTRTSVEDINVEGHDGFIAYSDDTNPATNLGISLCEAGIQFDDDFIEWSVSFAQKPFPDACEVVKELTRQSIVNAK